MEGTKISLADKFPHQGFFLLGRLVTFAKYARQTDKQYDYDGVVLKQDRKVHASGRVISVGVSKAGKAYFTLTNQMQRDVESGEFQPRAYRSEGISDLRINGSIQINDNDVEDAICSDVAHGSRLFIERGL